MQFDVVVDDGTPRIEAHYCRTCSNEGEGACSQGAQAFDEAKESLARWYEKLATWCRDQTEENWAYKR